MSPKISCLWEYSNGFVRTNAYIMRTLDQNLNKIPTVSFFKLPNRNCIQKVLSTKLWQSVRPSRVSWGFLLIIKIMCLHNVISKTCLVPFASCFSSLKLFKIKPLYLKVGTHKHKFTMEAMLLSVHVVVKASYFCCISCRHK